MADDKDFEDFEDLDIILHSEEFKRDYNNTVYQPTGISWTGKRLDHSGMTIEDISGFPKPEGYYSSSLSK